MRTSHEWVEYFTENLQRKRINWEQPATISHKELKKILRSMQAWQLGETYDGSGLLRAATSYSKRIDDPDYIKAIQLFIKEEQKHGNNLGKYLDLIGQPRIQRDLGDSLFRKVRHLNNSMEWWTITVIIVESAAQVFYQSLKDATNCKLLKEICTDILMDEAPHIQFQLERLDNIFQTKSPMGKFISYYAYKLFFLFVSQVIWIVNSKLFQAGKNDFLKYNRKMNFKSIKTIGKLKNKTQENYVIQPY